MPDRIDRIFLVVVDTTDPDMDIAALRGFITTSDEVSNWWNHIPGTYIVTTGLTVDELSDRLKSLTGDARFLVIHIDPAESEGWLPERAWRWIKRRSRERTKVAAAS